MPDVEVRTGRAGDTTLEELTAETFHPADQAAAAVLRGRSRTASFEDTTV